MTVIGLTGNIASGKSAVASILADWGCLIINADQIGKDVVAPGLPAYAQLKTAFGQAFFLPDGRLDRSKLGAYVFGNPQALATLNAITHPAIFQQIEQLILENLAKHPQQIVVMEAALLFEANLVANTKGLVQCIWLVKVPPQTQLQRLIHRDTIPKELALKKINSQMAQAEKEKRADYVIHNDGDLIALQAETWRVWQQFLKALVQTGNPQARCK